MRSWMGMGGALALMLSLAAGCGGDEEEPEGFHESAEAIAEHDRANAPVDEWEDDAPTAAEVPVEADFEGEAQASIDATNYSAELDRIEAELGAE
jgi:hypothetical protein